MNMNTSAFLLLLPLMAEILLISSAFSPIATTRTRTTTTIQTKKLSPLYSNDNNNNNDKDDGAAGEAKRLQEKANSLREQIRKMEESRPVRDTKMNNNDEYIKQKNDDDVDMNDGKKSLKNKTVLIVGANGRLGSMATRYILRNHPEVKEVIAGVHYVGEASTRGWGRLSYEVGAEDGVGTIGAAWSEDRDATFTYSDEMKDYNLNKLRIVDVELLDPVQVNTVMEGVDAVIYCATDFNGSTPRAVGTLNVAFLFRAIAAPTKGRVEVEGLMNVLGGLKQSKQDRIRVARMTSGDASTAETDNEKTEPTSFVLVSAAPYSLGNFETPFGSFNGIKRQGENMIRTDFPSLSHTVLQMSTYDDNFVEESLDIQYDDEPTSLTPDVMDYYEAAAGDEVNVDIRSLEQKLYGKSKRRINRRDAARCVVEALIDETLVDKTVEVWTDTRG